MKITVKRKTNKPRKQSKSNNMAKKKKGSKKKSSSSKGIFSGKILGQEVPVISKVLRNKNVQKAAAGAGLVAIALSVAKLVNNPTINKVLSRKEARIGLAYMGGDVVGAATQFVREGGIKQFSSGGSGMQSTSQVGFA